MASTARMESLTKRHEELEAAIAAEVKNPAYDELRVLELKRKKLLVKDTLENMRTSSTPN